MRRYLLTQKAITDLTEIWNYTINTWSENQADKYYEEILNFCQKLADNPKIGENYSQLIQDLKGSKINRHIIFYRETTQNTIEIERILHEHMDLKSRLKK